MIDALEFSDGFTVAFRENPERILRRTDKHTRNVALGRALLVHGMSYVEAARVAGVSRFTASRLLRRLAPEEYARRKAERSRTRAEILANRSAQYRRYYARNREMILAKRKPSAPPAHPPEVSV